MERHRRRWLVVWVLVSVVAIAAAFVAGLFVRSPWDKATANAATNVIVTEAVSSRDFTPDPPVLHAKVAIGREFSVPIPAQEGTAIVTRRYVKPGADVRSGGALLEVSGRPIIALDIPFGLYRTITPGSSGSDVLAVQKALVDLKLYPVAAVDGVYGTGTSRAISTLYTVAGTTPPAPDAEAKSRLKEAEEALTTTKEKPTSAAYAKLVRERDEAGAAAATPLPMSEIVAVSGSKLRLVGLPSVGAVLSGDASSALRFRGGEPSSTGRASISAKDAFGPGTKVVVRSESEQRDPLQGQVSGVSAFKSDDPAGYDVKVELTSAVKGWADGDEVTIQLAAKQQKVSGLGVPLTAIREDSEGQYVWVRVSGEKLQRARVTLGAERDGYVEVTKSPLTVGAQVVVAGR